MNALRMVMDAHELEALIASEARRQFAELPYEIRLKIRRALAKTHNAIIADAITIIIGVVTMVSVNGPWPIMLLMLAATIDQAVDLRRRCLEARYARLSGITPYRHKTVGLNQILAQLDGTGGTR